MPADGTSPTAGQAEGRRLRATPPMPNWSLVTSRRARRALRAIVEVGRCERRWNGLNGSEDRVRRAVLELYAQAGRAPSIAEIGEAAGLDPSAVRSLLGRLRDRDLVVLDPRSGEVAGAYPFCERIAGHEVVLGGRTLNTMCAIDALGVGAMLRSDAKIASSCRYCGREIRITTSGRGETLGSFLPRETLVWAGIACTGDSAATSLCQVLVFLCYRTHLRLWRRSNPRGKGLKLSLKEALEVGKALFSDRLFPRPAPGLPDRPSAAPS